MHVCIYMYIYIYIYIPVYYYTINTICILFGQPGVRAVPGQGAARPGIGASEVHK